MIRILITGVVSEVAGTIIRRISEPGHLASLADRIPHALNEILAVSYFQIVVSSIGQSDGRFQLPF